ncbi:MAG: hypothetical protein ACK4NZ_11235 [Tsuneonella sp.]
MSEEMTRRGFKFVGPTIVMDAGCRRCKRSFDRLLSA